jgi:hypothetical protein
MRCVEVSGELERLSKSVSRGAGETFGALKRNAGIVTWSKVAHEVSTGMCLGMTGVQGP